METFTLELTKDEFDLLKTYIPSITLQNVTAADAIKVGNIIVGLQEKLDKLVKEETTEVTS
jgi:hypothetical protein